MGSATSIAINAIITVPNNTGNIPKEPWAATWSDLIAMLGAQCNPNKKSKNGYSEKNLIASNRSDAIIAIVVKMAIRADTKNKTLKNFSTLIRAFDKIFILEDTITPRIEETNKTDKALIEYSFERELLYCSESFKTKASLLEIAPSAIFFIFAKINWISASVRFSFDEDIFWI